MSERWAMLLVIFFTRTALGFQFQSIAALTPFLVTAFDISWAQVGLLMGLFMLPGVIFALPGGLLGQRFGSRRVVFAGLGLMITGGMLVAYAGGFASAAVGRTLCDAPIIEPAVKPIRRSRHTVSERSAWALFQRQSRSPVAREAPHPPLHWSTCQ